MIKSKNKRLKVLLIISLFFADFALAQHNYYDLDRDNLEDMVVLEKGLLTVNFGNKTSSSIELPEITALMNTKIEYINPYEIAVYYSGDKVLYATINIFYKKEWCIKNVNFYNPCQECEDQNFKILTKSINLPLKTVDSDMLEIDSKGFKSLTFFDNIGIIKPYKDIKKLYADVSNYPLLAKSFNKSTLSDFRTKFTLSRADLDDYNNIAYTLTENGNYPIGIELLKQIIDKFPARMVAYLNLADSYWALGDKESAKENYSKYLTLMKSQKKELNKIPKYIGERIK
ncbi:tetratricopeptide repeat protein [Chryseobacterium sp. Mn2064]|uniref:tetratricopeptide repeat protein n=1 Tax=Chryseobacterium sp. Mn2064 TaxID=3395263 RepID=UPI003BBF76B8